MSEYIYEHKPSGADHIGKPVELPTLVQREEIVRCRDCRRFDDERSYCNFFEDEVWFDGFCAWAVKRKEDGE